MPRKRTKAKKANIRKRGRSFSRMRKSLAEKTSFSIWLIKTSIILAMWGIIAFSILLSYYAYDLPDVKKLDENIKTPAIRILDRDNNLIANFGSLHSEYVPYEKLPKNLINAVTSIEDRRFFKHFGIDLVGILRAAVRNSVAGGVVQGGSTITQQLAKVVFLSPDRTIRRKIQEVMLALYIEKHYTKQQIIAMYLNRIYLGNGNYGVDAASRSYFGKRVTDIGLYESAMLAGLIKAPSKYSPASNNLDLTKQRTDTVLASMVENGVITPSEMVFNMKDLNLSVRTRVIKTESPYFVQWIKEQLPDYVGNQEMEVVVHTTLDSNMQKLAEKSFEAHLAESGAEKGISQGAMVVMSPQGDILSMIGGRSFGDSQFNRATQALRQPGSSFKLFVYLAAFENGFEPNDKLIDEPIKLRNWSPENYDDKYIGEVSLMDAFAKSINTISVKLSQSVGIRKVIDVAYRLGISTEINRDLSSALGTSDVTLLDMTGAYAHLANYGNALWVHGITEITNGDGNVIYLRHQSENHRILSPEVVSNMNKLLLSVVDYGTGKRAQIGFPAAGKTGTSQNYRDAWFIGFTSNYVAGIWVGNDDNKPMKKVAGGSIPAAIWHDFMQPVMANVTNDTSIPTNESDIADGRAINDYEKNSVDNEESIEKTKENTDSVWDNIIRTFDTDKRKPEPKPQAPSTEIQEQDIPPIPENSYMNENKQEEVSPEGEPVPDEY